MQKNVWQYLYNSATEWKEILLSVPSRDGEPLFFCSGPLSYGEKSMVRLISRKQIYSFLVFFFKEEDHKIWHILLELNEHKISLNVKNF